MCGLCGVFSYRGSEGPAAAELPGMCDAMRTRGPDGRGSWHSDDGRLTFGHLRLAIIDLSDDGLQPLHSVDGRYSIVFNGEIYNYRELRQELEREGAVFRSRSDTEVIVELFRRVGTAAFGRLRGMFAVAIWDELSSELVLARDPFGIKPLYVADDGRTIRFASQVKALLAGGAVPRDLDPAGEVGFYIWGHVPEPFTLFKAIHAFPAGHHQIIGRDGAAEPVPFATVRDVILRARDVPPLAGAEARELVRSAVAASVRYHHVADVPVGVFLSAGIDSAVLASASSEQVGRGLTTFTLGFDEFRGSDRDETGLASALAQDLGTDHVTRWVKAEDFAAGYGALLAAMDQPSIDGVNTFFVSKLAAEAGLKVVLSGLGGDEMFGGYPSFAEVPRIQRLASTVPAARRLGGAVRAATAPWLGRVASPKYAGLLEYGSSLFGAYLLRRSLHMPWELPAFLDPDLVRAGLDRLRIMEHGEALVAGIDNPHAAVTLLEMTYYMRDRLLRDSDWASMAHSLELRVPLVDWTLFETLAPLIVANDPPRKRSLASVPARRLPAPVLDRPKTGFEVPIRAWLQKGSATGADRGLRDWSKVVHRAAAA